jgi:hypothetical protein
MDRVTRRGFIVAGAGAAAGAAGAAAIVLPAGAASASTHESEAMTAANTDAAHGVVVHVRDARRGELVIMAEDSEVTVIDRQLAAALGRAARTGKRG